MYITIDGHPCAGKTTISNILSDKIENCKHINLTNFIARGGSKVDFEGKYEHFLFECYLPSWLIAARGIAARDFVIRDIDNVVIGLAKSYNIPFVKDRTHLHFYLDLEYDEYVSRLKKRDHIDLTKSSITYENEKKIFCNRRSLYQDLVDKGYLIKLLSIESPEKIVQKIIGDINAIK